MKPALTEYRALAFVLFLLAGCGKQAPPASTDQRIQKTPNEKPGASVAGEERPMKRKSDPVSALKRLGAFLETDDQGNITSVSLALGFGEAAPSTRLPRTRLTDADLECLKGLDKIELLMVSNQSRITDAGLVHLKELKSLKHLSLDLTSIGDTGLSHLTGLTNLESLTLEGTKVTDAGLKQLKQFPKLSWLGVAGTKITKRGIANFKKSMPKCQVQWPYGNYVRRPAATVAEGPDPPVQDRAGYPSRSLPKEVRDVLSWLPEDTETIRVMQGEFKILSNPWKLNRPARRFPSFSQLLQDSMYSLLRRLRDGEYCERIVDKRLALVVEGARNFRTAIGGGQFQGAQVLIFKDDLGKAGDDLLRSIHSDAMATEMLLGHRIARFEQQADGEKWTFFITRPQPKMLLVATHKEYLQTVLGRMSGKKDKAKWWITLPEWQEVDIRAPVLWIRHFAKTGTEKDQSSPYASGDDEAAYLVVDPLAGFGWEAPDPKAIGLAFSYNPDVDKILKVRYLTGSPIALTVAGHAWQIPQQPKPRWPVVQRLKGNVIEVTHLLDGHPASYDALRVLLGRFGHAF